MRLAPPDPHTGVATWSCIHKSEFIEIHCYKSPGKDRTTIFLQPTMGFEISDDVLSQLQSGKLSVRQKPGPNNALGLVKLMFPPATLKTRTVPVLRTTLTELALLPKLDGDVLKRIATAVA